MKLNQLSPAKGAVKKVRRVGRGSGSGRGKTAGRGSKGQKSRAGVRIPPWFEGGQMPLQRRLPKRGFTNPFAKTFAVVNVGQLEDRFESGQVVDQAALIEAGLVKKTLDGVKLLGDGQLKKSLTVKVARASKTAVDKIEAAGGKVEV
ncbi:MAG: 50S ribosomal protein L15 [Deltaproteobacteria bacterium]|nr:50S ribosomal protein L15 [Deltaproteobacteria bacterium]